MVWRQFTPKTFLLAPPMRDIEGLEPYTIRIVGERTLMVERDTELGQVRDIVEAKAPLTNSQLVNSDFLSALSRALEIGLVQWSAKEIEGDGAVIWQVVGKDGKCRGGSAFICNNRQVVASQVVKDDGRFEVPFRARASDRVELRVGDTLNCNEGRFISSWVVPEVEPGRLL